MQHAPEQFTQERDRYSDLPSVIRQTGWRSGFFPVPDDGCRYYNPAIVQRNDGRWLVARRSTPWSHPWFKHGFNRLTAFPVHDDHRLGEPRHLAMPVTYKDEQFEDPRAIQVGDITMVSAANFQVPLDPGGFFGFHQVLIPYDAGWQPQGRFDPIHGFNGATVLMNTGPEKNWTWFTHDRAPHLIYQTQPHEVVRFSNADGGLAAVERWHCAPSLDLPWIGGHPRGGAPAVRVGDEYVCFFHSQQRWVGHTDLYRCRYHMGAYAFDAKPPFAITRITQFPLLSGSQRDPYWAHVVAFPCGALLRDGTWTVTFGVNDLACAWVEIPHEDLLSRLKPVGPPPQVGYEKMAP